MTGKNWTPSKTGVVCNALFMPDDYVKEMIYGTSDILLSVHIHFLGIQLELLNVVVENGIHVARIS